MTETKTLAISGMTIPETINFKSETLNALTGRIATVASATSEALDNARIQISSILALVISENAYAEDFKTFAEYAKQTFNISGSNASQYVFSGSNYYNNSDVADIVDSLRAISSPSRRKDTPAMIYELRDVEPDVVRAALASGEINANTTLADLRKWGQDNCAVGSKRYEKLHKGEGEDGEPAATAIPTLEIYGTFGREDFSLTTNETPDTAEAVTAEAFRYFGIMLSIDGAPIVKSLPTLEDDSGKKSIKRAVAVTELGAAVYVQWRKVPAKVKPVIRFNPANIAIMVATFGRDETKRMTCLNDKELDAHLAQATADSEE